MVISTFIIYFSVFLADSFKFSVSGFSSGSMFANQFHLCYSKSISGVGIVAGGPYGCGLLEGGRKTCSRSFTSQEIDQLIQNALQAASEGLIDPTKYLLTSKVYLFSGTSDKNIPYSSVKGTESFYDYFVDSDSIVTKYDIPAAHAFITDNYGNPCDFDGLPRINNCSFDLAGDILNNLIGNLSDKVQQVPSNVYKFSQNTGKSNFLDSGLDDFGWVYLPNTCKDRDCKVHVHFHGCGQGYGNLKDLYFNNIGFNEWAQANDIIVVYPQVKLLESQKNNWCWDYWGYTGKDYLYKTGPQISSVFNIIQSKLYLNISASSYN